MTEQYRSLTLAERTAVEQLTLRGASSGFSAWQLGIKKPTVAAIAKRVRRIGHAARPPPAPVGPLRSTRKR